MFWVLLATTALLSGLTLLPFSSSDHWVVRVWEFPRVQISVLLTLNSFFSVYVAFYEPNGYFAFACTIINMACLFYQLLWIFPYTPLAKQKVRKVSSKEGQRELSFITSNVLMTNRAADKLIALVNKKQPDVLVTLESNQWWQDALEVLHKDYPFRVARPLDNLYGMHVYSRYPLKNIEVVDLIEKDIPSVHCDLELNDTTSIECHFLHPCPPSPTENETAKPRDHELLLVARQVKGNEHATIVTGDLNDVAWSPTTRAFIRTSGLLDPRIGRGMFNTFHADHAFARWPLDHIFHSQHFSLIELQRLPSIGSDHFPLYSRFAVTQ